jgi:thiamine-monophosphate kinase
MAALQATGQLLWSCDMLCDGVDFRSQEHTWYDIGRKAAGASLSDCAAMASRPTAMLCSVCLQESMSEDDALELLRGVHDMGAQFECLLAGGDTNSWPHPSVIDVAIASSIPEGRQAVLRSGARPGDVIYVSGLLGGSILGRHLRFTPRVRLGLQIAEHLQPHAMIDISDGLALDLWRICEASVCGAVLIAEQIDAVIHPDARRLAKQTGRPPREHALFDGEDFELLVVLGSDAPQGSVAQLDLHRIGDIVAAPETFALRDSAGRIHPLEARGWEHFR